MRLRYVADRDGNLVVSRLPDPEFEDVRSEERPDCAAQVEDPNVYDGAGHAIGNYR